MLVDKSQQFFMGKVKLVEIYVSLVKDIEICIVVLTNAKMLIKIEEIYFRVKINPSHTNMVEGKRPAKQC